MQRVGVGRRRRDGGWMDGWALRKWEDWSVNQREGGAAKQEGEEGEGKKEGVKFSKTT